MYVAAWQAHGFFSFSFLGTYPLCQRTLSPTSLATAYLPSSSALSATLAAPFSNCRCPSVLLTIPRQQAAVSNDPSSMHRSKRPDAGPVAASTLGEA